MMRLTLYPDQRRSWAVLKSRCRSAVDDGWDGIWLCDHLLRPPDEPPGYFLECWTGLGALAASLPRGTIGTLVSANSMRHPALLAAMAASIQRISGGRLILGLGAGGGEEEHLALGLPFPSSRDRLDALAEACSVLRELLSPGAAHHAGALYDVDVADTGLHVGFSVPLLVGVEGDRGLDIVARYADRWAVWGDPDRLSERGRRLDRLCERRDRDPASVTRAAIVMLCVDETSGPWPARLPAEPGAVWKALSAYERAGVGELIICDYALPEADRDEVLRTFRRDVQAWQAAR